MDRYDNEDKNTRIGFFAHYVVEKTPHFKGGVGDCTAVHCRIAHTVVGCIPNRLVRVTVFWPSGRARERSFCLAVSNAASSASFLVMLGQNPHPQLLPPLPWSS
mgnify:FL=1